MSVLHGSKPFDTLIGFLKDFFEIDLADFENKSADDNKIMKNYPACKDLNALAIESN